MIVYWLMLLVPALLALPAVAADRRGPNFALAIILCVFFLLMAFRQTGGDYLNYVTFTELIEYRNIDFVIKQTEILYGLLNYISVNLGAGIYGVNVVCAIIVLYSLYRFVREEPYPLLSVFVATGYFIIVVAIGYSRQGVAIALLMWGITYLRKGKILPYAAILLLALGFHTSAAIGVPLLMFGVRIRNRPLRLVVSLALVSVALLGVYALFFDTFDTYIRGYVETTGISSSGAVFRIAVSVVAATLFLIYRKRLAVSDQRIWTAVALLTFASLPLFFVSTTVVDRIGLYLLPLQIIVFGRLPAMISVASRRAFVAVGIVIAYIASFWVWMFVGTFAQKYWLPYENLLFGTFP